eukprot:3392386-Rhodomonas_salina.2
MEHTRKTRTTAAEGMKRRKKRMSGGATRTSKPKEPSVLSCKPKAVSELEGLDWPRVQSIPGATLPRYHLSSAGNDDDYDDDIDE